MKCLTCFDLLSKGEHIFDVIGDEPHSLFTRGDHHFETEKEKVFPPPLLLLRSFTNILLQLQLQLQMYLLFSSNTTSSTTTGHEEGGGGVRSHELDDDNQTRLRWNARERTSETTKLPQLFLRIE